METVSVVIVNWNTRGYLRDCLMSIRRYPAELDCEVIVVDNNSSDGSADMVATDFPEVTLIRADANLGFARANNLAMSRARGDWLALVNSDALVHAGCLQRLCDYLSRHPDVALVGPRVTGGDGRLQRTCRHLPGVWNTLCRTLALDRVLPESRYFGGYEMPSRDHETEFDAEVLSGCFCIARRQAVEQVGGLDEQFFFYGEDIDWCKRFADAGWRKVFVPSATATHFGGGSTANAPLRYSIEILRATLKYWRKHHGVTGETLCRGLLMAHHGVRLVLRLGVRYVGQRRTPASDHKCQEDAVCLRWLFTGQGVAIAQPSSLQAESHRT